MRRSWSMIASSTCGSVSGSAIARPTSSSTARSSALRRVSK
jgi:hypothetical protein